MEYYDGFVFGFHATNHAGLSPIATGGRYDALTQRLGKGDAIPAVGGVIRPDLLIQIAGGAS
jgi:ATP phosphoribosyltransferase regulatory subunit